MLSFKSDKASRNRGPIANARKVILLTVILLAIPLPSIAKSVGKVKIVRGNRQTAKDCMPEFKPFNRDENCKRPGDIKEAEGYYDVERCDIWAHSWAAAHGGGNDNPNLIEISLGLKNPINVGGELWRTVQISIRPGDNKPHDCDQKETDRASYWQAGYFHFVETAAPDKLPDTFQRLILTDLKKSNVRVKFNPQDIAKSWYEIEIKPKK
jgi:hypothetical protein